MTATYTYNDALDDALRAIAAAIDKDGPDEKTMRIFIAIAGRLTELRRSTRRKRVKAQTAAGEANKECA